MRGLVQIMMRNLTASDSVAQLNIARMMRAMDGLIVLDKPAGMTSARAVDAVKRLLPRGTKVGHAGTLDPFATGVLLLLVGRATKQCEMLMDQAKSYEATIKLGATTATDDPESPEEPYGAGAIRPVSRATIEAALPRFVGEILQRPPVFSALKIAGKRAADRVRAGQHVELEPRRVRVYAIELVEYQWPSLKLKIDCGRGTYIRSIARDLGEVLNVGGYLTQLRRTRIGQFTADEAVSLAALSGQNVEQHLRAFTRAV
jgi:tRNA pseudouridine55 synthase